MRPWTPLSSRKEFLRALREGRRAEGEILFVRLLPRGEGRRAGFSAQGGFDNAVRRNRAKRWMREALRKNVALLPEDVDLILVAKTAMQKSGFAQVVSELGRLLSERS